MFKAVLIGEKSKIGKSILKNHSHWLTWLPEDSLKKETVDYLILASTAEKNQKYIKQYPKSPEIKFFDYSGILKQRFLNKDADVTIAFDPVFDKSKSLVAMPGCSSLAILNSLYPIKHLLPDNEIFIDLKFPKSALKYDSKNLIGLEDNLKGIMYGVHPHQDEVNFILEKTNITLIPSLVDVSSGINLNIYISNCDYTEIIDTLKTHYLNHKRINLIDENPSLKEVIGTGQTLIYVFRSKSGVVINTVIDNLINERYQDFLNL